VSRVTVPPPRPRRIPLQVSRRRAAWGSAVILLALGVGDYVTGVDLTFTLLYLFAIGAGTWFAGARVGVGLSILATVCGTVSIVLTPPAWPLLTTVWNEAGAFVMYLAGVALVARLHAYIEQEQRSRRIAIEQLRHAERLNVIGSLAAGVAHEIGTPLTVISGTAELLGDARGPDDLSEMAHTIKDQTDRISRIIRHLLDFGRRGGSGRIAIDLGDAVGAAVALLASTARKRSSRIRLVASDLPVPVRANLSELEQVFSNLILNALQAMPAGGEVVVRVGVADGAESDDGERRFGRVTVEDRGAGISAADLPRIFDPFFTTKGVGEGTGLGLSVSYGIVQDHSGIIEVDSAPGRGSRFTVMLPLEAPAAAAATPPSHGAGGRAGGPRARPAPRAG
jgi:signal transduction histidine kinase